MNSVTLAAGPWLLHAPVSVLGTIPSVHEDYLTKQGVCLAPAKDATSTHIVLEIDRSRMKFYREHPNGRKTEKTVAEVMELREREVSQTQKLAGITMPTQIQNAHAIVRTNDSNAHPARVSV